MKLSELGSYETYLRLYGVLTSLSIAKAKFDPYLKLERKFAAELIKNWRQKFDLALKKIFEVIPETVSQEAKEIILSGLSEALGGKFGQSRTVRQLFQNYIRRAYEGAKKDFAVESSFNLVDKRAVDVLTRHNCFWLGEHYGKHIGPKISKITQQALENGLGRRELAELLQETLGGEVGSYKYWDVVSSSALVRARSFGSIAGMEEAGITEYEILAMGDERTCEICEGMNGKIFSVSETRKVIDKVLDIEDPEKFKEAMPWQVRMPVEMSNYSLEKSGMSLPPFHGRCRCIVVMADEWSPSSSFSFNEEFEREKIRNGYYSSKVNIQKQARHIEGTNENKRYIASTVSKGGKMPSVLYGDTKVAQALIDKYKATGLIKMNGKNSVSEIIHTKNIIGKYWGLKTERYYDTFMARIIYTRTDAHIFPIWGG